MRAILKKTFLIALLPLMLSGCTEVISFAAGFGAGYFTGQYMGSKDSQSARSVPSRPILTNRGPAGQGQQGQVPSARQQYATPYGHYAHGGYPMVAQPQPHPQQVQQYQQYQEYYAQHMRQQPRPYGVPIQTPPPASVETAPSGDVKGEAPSALDVPIISATPEASYQPLTPDAPATAAAPAAPQPLATAPTPLPPIPQAMVVPPMPPVAQSGGGYYVPPIATAPLQQQPAAPAAEGWVK